MDYIKSQYSRSKVDNAGKIISRYNKDDKKFADNISIVDYWRASHAFPLVEITKIINEGLKNKNSFKFVQRLKRLESVINKLKRENNTGLYRMQDLAGCRIIVQDISQVSEYIESIKKILINYGHKIIREYDYIKEPRNISGYRSYHIVLEYNSCESYNYNGMFVEIQIRTRLQNLWATTIEIIDFMMRDTLKAGTGKRIYMEFFKYISGLFSIEEGTKVVDGIPVEKNKIIDRIYEIDKQESIREKLSAYNNALKLVDNDKIIRDNAYYLLYTDLRKQEINVYPYYIKDINRAIGEYFNYEKKGIDVLLVSGENIQMIKDSYPNYFIDTSLFLQQIAKSCMGYPEKPSVILNMHLNSEKIIDLFDILDYKPTKGAFNLPDDVIGGSDETIISCPPYAVTLDNSYLRFSGINLDINDIKNKEISVNDVKFPGIVVLQTGASFFIDKLKWSFASKVGSIYIKCKKNTDIDYLKLLISWIKSNVCLWNVLYNLHSHTISNKSIYSNLTIPILNDNRKIIENCNKILNEEKRFVTEYNQRLNNNEMKDSDINDFNDNIRKILIENEKVYYEHYKINNASIDLIKSDLKVKGYFVY